MPNKFKKFAISALLLASVASLAACDDIESGLTADKYDEKILNVDDISNNNLGVIYDALISSGSTNSKTVMTNILRILAKQAFGDFYGDNGIHAAVVDYRNGNSAKIDAFINAHKAVEPYNFKMYEYDESKDLAKIGTTNVTEDNKKVIAREKVCDIHDQMMEVINKNFFDAASNSSYQENNVFKEEKFFNSQINALYKISGAHNHSKAVDGKDTYEDAATYFGGEENMLTVYKDYVERSILNDVYDKLLVSQYLYDNNYAVLGRTYARKVQYINLGTSTAYPDATQRLINTYAAEVLEAGTAFSALAEADQEEVKDLSFLSELYKGNIALPGSSYASTVVAFADTIYSKAGFHKVSYPAANEATLTALCGDANHVYQETTYGGYVTDYLKITDNRFTTDSSVENDYTGGNSHTKETGMRMKQNNLRAVDHTTEGWFNSSELTSLPSSMKTRLFRISTANEIESTSNGTYLAYVGEDHYLIPDATDKTDTNLRPYVMFDSSSNSYYIVRVEEAVKSTKLALNNPETSYDNDADLADNASLTKKSRIARKIAYMLSGTDSYVDSSNEYFVKKMAISFHDDYVYDYFETTFPDLFN